jgi:hypothetical protein
MVPLDGPRRTVGAPWGKGGWSADADAGGDVDPECRPAGAHRLYEQLGYVRSGGFRERRDLSQSMEYHFVKLLAAAPGRPG